MMNFPLMRRGLSPEGRKIRDRHQGSLTIGIQGVTVHPAERGRTQNNFLQDNVRRLHEIQSRCKERDNSKRSQPLKATRQGSGSTTSSLREADALRPVRNGSTKLKRSQSLEREGSAHSDYFSLTEEQIEPLVPYCTQSISQPDGSDTADARVISKNEWNTENIVSPVRSPDHHSHIQQTNSKIYSLDSRQQSRSGSPVVLRPITTRDTQTTPTPMVPALRQTSGRNQMILSDYELTQEMRKMRMDNIMSRIKTQKPSCELDYNSLYKSIENQHKMLLDNSDRLSLCGSSEGSARNLAGTQRSGTKSRTQAVAGRPGSLKMLRANSFDRDLLNKRNGNVATKPDKLNNTNNKNYIKKNSVHPLSPQLRKRFSKSNNNLVRADSSLSRESGFQDISVHTVHKGRKLTSNDGICGSAQSPKKHDLPNGRAMQRSKSNVEGPQVKCSIGNRVESSPHSYNQTSARGVCSENKSCDETTNANVPMTGTSSEDLNLSKAPSCNSDMNIDDHNYSVLNEPGGEEFHLNIRPESQSYMSVVDQNEDDRVFPEDVNFNAFDTPCHDVEAIQDENDPETEDVRTSTPVSNNLHDVPLANTAPKPVKKKETHQAKVSTASAPKSQSLKNVQHHPGNLPSTYKKGKIPKYILARKEEDRRKAELALAVDPDCPPGHTPLPDHERRNTLHLLRKSQAEVMRELSSLPVAQDTLRVKKLRHSLEEKLTQIEDGLRIFSQPKVYVMNDE